MENEVICILYTDREHIEDGDIRKGKLCTIAVTEKYKFLQSFFE